MSVEGMIRNIRKSDISNYEIMAQNSRKAFIQYDMDEICRKPGIRSDQENIYVTLLGSEYRINKSSGEVSPRGYLEAMIIYDLLAFSKPEAHPSSEFLPIQNLSRMQNAHSYAGEGMFADYERYFDGKTELLEKCCESLGGTKFGKGDVAYKLPFFNDLCIALSFYESDDEFPPTLNIMFDSNTLDYIHYETAWYAAVHAFKKLSEMMREK